MGKRRGRLYGAELIDARALHVSNSAYIHRTDAFISFRRVELN